MLSSTDLILVIPHSLKTHEYLTHCYLLCCQVLPLSCLALASMWITCQILCPLHSLTSSSPAMFFSTPFQPPTSMAILGYPGPTQLCNIKFKSLLSDYSEVLNFQLHLILRLCRKLQFSFLSTITHLHFSCIAWTSSLQCSFLSLSSATRSCPLYTDFCLTTPVSPLSHGNQQPATCCYYYLNILL